MLINSIQDLQALLASGFADWKSIGNVNTKTKDDLTLFNYSAKATYGEEWNFFELISRGLILNNKTGEVVARPFDKFFNYGQGGRYPTTPIKAVTEKMDGSLGILYRDNGEYKIATRGSFDSDQALWATEFLKNYDLSELSPEVTLLFEIIYPENRVVVDYAGIEALALIGARNRFTGEYFDREKLLYMVLATGFPVVSEAKFDNPAEIIFACKTLHGNAEGWVVEFEGWERFKFKGEQYMGEQYMELHKLTTSLSFKTVLEHIKAETLDTLLEQIPDEFMGQAKQWSDEIHDTLFRITNVVDAIFSVAPRTEGRKAFAQWVMKQHKKLAPYLFARLDGKPIKPLICKLAFKKTPVYFEGHPLVYFSYYFQKRIIMDKLYDYGITFWREETDHEICAIFQARNWFDAEIIVKPVQVDGYIKGQSTFIEDKDKSYYTVPLNDLINQGE